MIGYVSGHVKARRAISMVQRGSTGMRAYGCSFLRIGDDFATGNDIFSRYVISLRLRSI
jgi:hypothetical protein